MRCRVTRARVDVADDPAHPGLWSARHIDRCLGCRAHTARALTIRRQLRALAAERVAAPEGFVSAVMAALGTPLQEPTGRGREVRLVAAGAAVAVAGAVAVLGWRRLRAA